MIIFKTRSKLSLAAYLSSLKHVTVFFLFNQWINWVRHVKRLEISVLKSLFLIAVWNCILKSSLRSLQTGPFAFSVLPHECYGLGCYAALYPTGVRCHGSVPQQRDGWYYVTGFYVSVHKLQSPHSRFITGPLFSLSLSRSLKSFWPSAGRQTATLAELSC